MDFANGIGGKPKITVAADGSISGFTMGGNGSEQYLDQMVIWDIIMSMMSRLYS